MTIKQWERIGGVGIWVTVAGMVGVLAYDCIYTTLLGTFIAGMLLGSLLILAISRRLGV
jgi:hypothetical protein